MITRKQSETKTKEPHAISGADCYKLMQSKQDEKQRQQESKGKRSKKSKNSTEEHGEVVDNSRVVDETAISLHTDDEDSLDNNSHNDVCFACLGSEDWDVPDAWIRCSTEKCGWWFHKNCLSEDVSSMTQQQLDDYDFYCKSCEQRNMK